MGAERTIKILGTILMLSLVIFANFVTVRMMMADGIELNFYDKALTAYQAGGMTALKDELRRIEEKSGAGAKLAADLGAKLGSMEDPASFLGKTADAKRDRFILYRKLRSWAIGILIALLLLRLSANLFARKKSM